MKTDKSVKKVIYIGRFWVAFGMDVHQFKLLSVTVGETFAWAGKVESFSVFDIQFAIFFFSIGVFIRRKDE